MGFSLVATVVGSVISGAMWGLAGGIDMPPVSLQEVGTSDVVSLHAVLSLRLICAAVALYTLWCVYFNRAGLELSYRGATVRLYRLSRWTTFTVWCFTTIFLYFALAAYCSGMSLAGRSQPIHPAIVQATLILFEVSYPMSLLVTVVVTFVLIPAALRTDHPIPRMFRWRPLMMHNGNVLMMQLAMLIAPPPVTLSHLPYAMLAQFTPLDEQLPVIRSRSRLEKLICRLYSHCRVFPSMTCPSIRPGEDDDRQRPLLVVGLPSRHHRYRSTLAHQTDFGNPIVYTNAYYYTYNPSCVEVGRDSGKAKIHMRSTLRVDKNAQVRSTR
jgi:hypothetical protein